MPIRLFEDLPLPFDAVRGLSRPPRDERRRRNQNSHPRKGLFRIPSIEDIPQYVSESRLEPRIPNRIKLNATNRAGAR